MRRLSLSKWAAALSVAALLSGCAGTPPKRFTQAQAPDRFTACSSAPRCVSSQAATDSSHYVAPFKYTGDAAHASEVLRKALREGGHATVESAEAHFIHATYRSAIVGFVDDVTFIIQPQQHFIDVKSSSRLGYYDFGVNRRRVERLRARFETLLQQGS